MTTRTLEVRTGEAAPLYARLEERVMDRDQRGASDAFYELVREGRSLDEMIRETVRVHAPFTHMPYHQRIDDGVVRFVNNDHCLLSARASWRMPEFLPERLRFLPMAQTIWYVPTGLDPWNQLLGKAPGHYGRRVYDETKYPVPPAPTRHWEDSEAVASEGNLDERLNHWLTLVQYGQVDESYGVFRGLLEQPEDRPRVLAQLMFAGLIDVQDRILLNRSYTTGHKSYRARATIELAGAVGWDQAHDVIYAGVPDIAVGPRWYSAYEMACEVARTRLEDEAAESSLAATVLSGVDERLFAQTVELSSAEREGLKRSLLEEPEPSYIEAIIALLKAGRSPKQILDTIQVAAAEVVLRCGEGPSFSMPQHGYEYTNTLAWFFENFEHKHKTKLLFVAGSFINQCAMWVRNSPGNGKPVFRAPASAKDMSRDQLLTRLDSAMASLEPDEAASWVQAYLDAGHEPRPLIGTLALGAAKQGNDPHNQEIGLCMIEDYGRTSSPDRDRLLLACAKHTAGHSKYGNSLEAYGRFADQFDLPPAIGVSGDRDPIEAVLDELEVIPLSEIEDMPKGLMLN
jgi:hypothetical protein